MPILTVFCAGAAQAVVADLAAKLEREGSHAVALDLHRGDIDVDDAGAFAARGGQQLGRGIGGRDDCGLEYDLTHLPEPAARDRPRADA